MEYVKPVQVSNVCIWNVLRFDRKKKLITLLVYFAPRK